MGLAEAATPTNSTRCGSSAATAAATSMAVRMLPAPSSATCTVQSTWSPAKSPTSKRVVRTRLGLRSGRCAATASYSSCSAVKITAVMRGRRMCSSPCAAVPAASCSQLCIIGLLASRLHNVERPSMLDTTKPALLSTASADVAVVGAMLSARARARPLTGALERASDSSARNAVSSSRARS